jgi:hypothetical protein
MTRLLGLGGIGVALAIVLVPAAGYATSLAPVNMALGAPTEQSSTIYGDDSSIAVDGVDGGDWSDGSAILTGADFHSWWQTDLGLERHIGSLEIINRTDCCQDSLFPFVVIVADFPLIESDITDADGSTYPGVTRIVVGDTIRDKYVVPVHRRGRYVMVALLREYTNLSLGEVKVFEEYNAAIERTARMSTVNGDDYATRANDNNIDGEASQGSTDVAVKNSTYKTPFWSISLDNLTAVDTVDVWTTNTTCCSTVTPRPTFTLYATPTAFSLTGTPTLPAGAIKKTGNVQGAPATVQVGVDANFIVLQLESVDALSLAEVQVWPLARGSVGSHPTISSKARTSTDPFAAIDLRTGPAGNDLAPRDAVTAAQTDPYYELDLGGDRYVETIKLWGESDLSSTPRVSVWTSELNKFPAGATVAQLRANQLNSGAVENLTVGTNADATVYIGRKVRFIRVTIEGASQVLGLRELEIYTNEGYVESPTNGQGLPSATAAFASGFHSRPNESIDVFAFTPNAHTQSGLLDNWSYLGTGQSSSTPEIVKNAVAPMYAWRLPTAEPLPANAWQPGGMLGILAQANVLPGPSPIAEPLRGLDQRFVDGSATNQDDLFWPHIRTPANDKSPDTNPTPPAYLTKPMGHVVNSAYYNLNAASTYREFPPTLAQFNSQYALGSSVMTAKYYNAGDLGIGRKMTCASRGWVANTTHVRGDICAVSNYAPAATPPSTAPIVFGDETRSVGLIKDNAPPFATVVMVKRTGAPTALFGVYVPSTIPPTTDTAKTKLVQDKVFLDSKGANQAVPNNCVACHGGSAGTNPLSLTASINFLPFDPAAVGTKGGTGFDWKSQEEAFRQLNNFVYQTNPAAGIRDFIDGTYHTKQGTSGTKADPTYIPAGWSDSLGEKDVYNKLVKPYCRGCHMSQTGLNLLKASDLEGLRATVLSDVCITHTMPHSQQTMLKAWPSSARAKLLAFLGRDDVDQTTMNLEACKP